MAYYHEVQRTQSKYRSPKSKFRLIWAHGELTGMKRSDNLSNESFGLNSEFDFTRFHKPVHVGYTRYFRPTSTVCTTTKYSALHDSLLRETVAARPLPVHTIRTRTERDGRTVARPGIALRRSLQPAQQLRLNKSSPTHRMPMAAVRCNWPRSQTTHPCTTKVDSHANRASKAAIQPSIVCRLVVEPTCHWMDCGATNGQRLR